MFGQLQLRFEDVIKLTDNANVVYYQAGSKFSTTKKTMLERCRLNDKQKFTVSQYPEGQIVLETIITGVFELKIT